MMQAQRLQRSCGHGCPGSTVKTHQTGAHALSGMNASPQRFELETGICKQSLSEMSSATGLIKTFMLRRSC